MNLKCKMVAELFGTFILVFAGCCAIVVNSEYYLISKKATLINLKLPFFNFTSYFNASFTTLKVYGS